MKNQNENLSENGLTDSNNMSNRKIILLNRLNETDFIGVIKIRRELKKYRVPSFEVFEMLCDQTINTEVTEFLEIVDDYLKENYSNKTNDFIEYKGETIKKSDVLVLVWEDKWCRNEGVTVKMNGFDFQGSEYESLIGSINEYYLDEIKSKRGCIEVEVNGKPILHISPDSKNKWEVF